MARDTVYPKPLAGPEITELQWKTSLKTSWATMALKSFREKNNINEYSMTFDYILKKQLLDVRIENIIFTVIMAVWFTVH